MFNDKRGISPVIATVLLVAIVVVLGFIIFLWARSVVQEDIQKFGESIKNICSEIQFSASSLGTSIVITNNGDRVPIYNIALNVQDSNRDITLVEYSSPISLAPGRSTTIDVSSYGEVIAITPILKGTKSGVEESYTCDQKVDVSS